MCSVRESVRISLRSKTSPPEPEFLPQRGRSTLPTGKGGRVSPMESGRCRLSPVRPQEPGRRITGPGPEVSRKGSVSRPWPPREVCEGWSPSRCRLPGPWPPNPLIPDPVRASVTLDLADGHHGTSREELQRASAINRGSALEFRLEVDELVGFGRWGGWRWCGLGWGPQRSRARNRVVTGLIVSSSRWAVAGAIQATYSAYNAPRRSHPQQPTSQTTTPQRDAGPPTPRRWPSQAQ